MSVLTRSLGGEYEHICFLNKCLGYGKNRELFQTPVIQTESFACRLSEFEKDHGTTDCWLSSFSEYA